MNINIPFEIGENCFAIWNKRDSQNKFCDTCKRMETRTIYTKTVESAILDGFNIIVKENKITIHYRVAFDDGKYGDTVSNVFKTIEEARIFLTGSQIDIDETSMF